MNASQKTQFTKTKGDLAAGILSQARRDLRRFHGSTRALQRELYLDAYDWVMSDNYSWPFSFRNVCGLLKLRPEVVRQELLGDLSLGTCRYWSRRFGRIIHQFQISLSQLLIQDAAPRATAFAHNSR